VQSDALRALTVDYRSHYLIGAQSISPFGRNDNTGVCLQKMRQGHLHPKCHPERRPHGMPFHTLPPRAAAKDRLPRIRLPRIRLDGCFCTIFDNHQYKAGALRAPLPGEMCIYLLTFKTVSMVDYPGLCGDERQGDSFSVYNFFVISIFLQLVRKLFGGT